MSGVGCQVPGARCSGARCQVPGARCQVFRCQVFRCRVPGARCQVPGVRCQVSGVGCVSRHWPLNLTRRERLSPLRSCRPDSLGLVQT